MTKGLPERRIKIKGAEKRKPCLAVSAFPCVEGDEGAIIEIRFENKKTNKL